MATLPRPQLFCWDSVDQLGDLQRLRLVLDALPDEPLMQILEAERGHGRDDYPVRPMWNSLIAAFVFGHPSIAALRRELLRNLQLRHRCGFDVFKGLEAVPSECAYTRFQRRLFDHEHEVEQIFHDAADLVQEVLPDFGQALAIDGKQLHSQANPRTTTTMSARSTATGGGNRMLIGGSRAARTSTPGSASCCIWRWTPPTSCRSPSRSPRPRRPSSRRRCG